ncbi:hypothetical protein PGT21_012157 [Puccinia graminis f. sp. tritici]|uniref:Uncharacterized protein n=1 Tax=Puccinia graminis f. sp. tritici TaxID=56615 RepID=A0A5B0QI61_PUCGR|nr:hypothetical protein PGT21_012157 [Puccinia graminis f. sp. tritici]
MTTRFLKPTSTQLTQRGSKTHPHQRTECTRHINYQIWGPVHSTPGARQQEIFPIATAVSLSGPATQNSRQVTYPQDSQPFPSGDSRALMNGQPNAPLPHPTQLPNSAGGSSKSPSPSTTTTTSLKSQATAVSHHSPSSATEASTTSAASAAPTDEPAPRSALERFAALYKPTNRFEPLAVLLTIVLILAFLVTLMSILKCVAHKKRFANKKDYPTGFRGLTLPEVRQTELVVDKVWLPLRATCRIEIR